MKRTISLLLALGLLSACKAPVTEPPSALQRAVASARSLPPCDATVPMEWPASWPIPAKEIGKFKIFFYPLRAAETDSPEVYSPAAEASIDAAQGTPISCGLTPSSSTQLSKTRWPAATAGLNLKDFEARARRLYDRTEAMAALYDGRRNLSALEKRSVQEFLELFESLAEPALLSDYYRLNPDFWEWLRTAAGRSIPPAEKRK